jgi:hypothetical protein
MGGRGGGAKQRLASGDGAAVAYLSLEKSSKEKGGSFGCHDHL